METITPDVTMANKVKKKAAPRKATAKKAAAKRAAPKTTKAKSKSSSKKKRPVLVNPHTSKAALRTARRAMNKYKAAKRKKS